MLVEQISNIRADYARIYEETIQRAINHLDDKLAARGEEVESEGFAFVIDMIDQYASDLKLDQSWATHKLFLKFRDSIGAEWSEGVAFLPWPLIKPILESAEADAYSDAADVGKIIAYSIDPAELGSVLEAILLLALCEESARAAPSLLMRKPEIETEQVPTNDRDLETVTRVLAGGRNTEFSNNTIKDLVTVGLAVTSVNESAPENYRPETQRLITEFDAMLCPPFGKGEHGTVGVVQFDSNIIAVFKSIHRGRDALPQGVVLDFPVNVKVKLGGRVELLGDRYLILNGKSEAKRLLAALGID